MIKVFSETISSLNKNITSGRSSIFHRKALVNVDDKPNALVTLASGSNAELMIHLVNGGVKFAAYVFMFIEDHSPLAGRPCLCGKVCSLRRYWFRKMALETDWGQ